MKSLKQGLYSSIASLVGNSASLILFPLEIIKTRLQVADGAANNTVPRYKGIIDALYKIPKKEGFSCLFRGVGSYFIGINLSNMIFFCVYGMGKELCNFDAKPTPLKSFAISTASSLTGTTCSAPFWTLTTRLNCFVNSPEYLRRSNELPKSSFGLFKHVYLVMDDFLTEAQPAAC